MKTRIWNDRDILPTSIFQRISILAITHTCSHWRNLTLSTPGLWTHIHYTPDNERLFEYARTCARRSQDLPLVVYFQTFREGGQASTDLISLTIYTLMSICPRVRKLVVNGNLGSIGEMLWGTVMGEAPFLEEIHFIRQPIGDLSFKSAPSLKRVRLGVSSPFLIAPNFTNLRSLVIDIRYASCQDLRVALPEILAALPRGLEELALRGTRYTNRQRVSPCTFEQNVTPAILRKLRKFVISGEGLNPQAAEVLSCFRIPDTTLRQFSLPCHRHLPIPPPPLDRLVMAGRIDPGLRRPSFKRLHLICNHRHPESEHRYFAVGMEALTFNHTCIPWTDHVPLFNSANPLLSEVEELAIIVPMRHVKRVDEVAKYLFPALPLLRKFTFSTGGGCETVLGKLVEELSRVAEGEDPGSARCPLLEEMSLLYYNPRDPPQSKWDGPHGLTELPLVLEFAEERKKRGRGLRKVVVERCSEGDLLALRSAVGEVCGVRRWTGGPIGYFEDEIFQASRACHGLAHP